MSVRDNEKKKNRTYAKGWSNKLGREGNTKKLYVTSSEEAIRKVDLLRMCLPGGGRKWKNCD